MVCLPTIVTHVNGKTNCFFILILAAQRPNLAASRSVSIQLIDSFAQTERISNIPEEAVESREIVDKDMVDSGLDPAIQRSDRLSVTETDEPTASYDIRSGSVGDDDEAVLVNVENPTSSQEVSIQLDFLFI